MTNEAKQRPCLYGYDGNGYDVGDRVEIHPGTDLWMRGARYGTVVRRSLTPLDRVHVKLDALGPNARPVAGTEDTFRRVDESVQPVPLNFYEGD